MNIATNYAKISFVCSVYCVRLVNICVDIVPYAGSAEVCYVLLSGILNSSWVASLKLETKKKNYSDIDPHSNIIPKTQQGFGNKFR